MKIRSSLILLLMLSLPFSGWTAEKAIAPVAVAKRIDVEQFDKLRGATNTVLLDVRSKAEFEKGHIPGATNIDVNSSRFVENVSSLDKSKTYLVNCAVGMRSAKACRQMETLGFTNLYDLAPGFDGWRKAGKPVEN